MASDSPTVTLNVMEAYTRDVGRNIARVDYETMTTIGAITGNVIEVRGKHRSTVSLCLPLYPSDERKGMVRLDGLTRNNAGVAIDYPVVIRKIQVLPAESVVIMPLEPVLPIDERYFTTALQGIPITINDNVMVPYFGGRLTFKVMAAAPGQIQDPAPSTSSLTSGAFMITAETRFMIKGREQGKIKFHITEYVRQGLGVDKPAPAAATRQADAPRIRTSLFLGLKLELFLGAIIEQVDFQKEIDDGGGASRTKDIARLAQKYAEIAKKEVDEANRSATESSELGELIANAEKSYPSAPVDDNEGKLRQLLRELKYKIVGKWADTEA